MLKVGLYINQTEQEGLPKIAPYIKYVKSKFCLTFSLKTLISKTIVESY